MTQMLVTISLYDGVKYGTLECEHMKSWNKYGDECDSKIQIYWFVTIDVLGGAVGIGQMTGTNDWLASANGIRTDDRD
jgi:hypothetical protein